MSHKKIFAKKVKKIATAIIGNGIYPHNTFILIDFHEAVDICYNSSGKWHRKNFYRVHNGAKTSDKEIWIEGKHLKDIKDR